LTVLTSLAQESEIEEPQAVHWLRPGIAERVSIAPAAAGRPRTLTIRVSCTGRFVVRTAILAAWPGWRSNALLW
jgi:hypothetical protein